VSKGSATMNESRVQAGVARGTANRLRDKGGGGRGTKGESVRREIFAQRSERRERRESEQREGLGWWKEGRRESGPVKGGCVLWLKSLSEQSCQ